MSNHIKIGSITIYPELDFLYFVHLGIISAVFYALLIFIYHLKIPYLIILGALTLVDISVHSILQID